MGQLERLVAPYVPELHLDTNADKTAEGKHAMVISHLVNSQNSSCTLPAVSLLNPRSANLHHCSAPGYMSRKVVSSIEFAELLEHARSAAVTQVAVDISLYITW